MLLPVPFDAGEFGSDLLEQGSKLRGYRHPLKEVRAIDEELADQFMALSSQLERPESQVAESKAPHICDRMTGNAILSHKLLNIGRICHAESLPSEARLL